MIRLTVSLPEDLVDRARALAAERGVSVSGLVRRLLMQATAEEDPNEAWEGELALMRAGRLLRIGGTPRLRDELHDRH